jgi:NAD(P)-dependent dehydrogenase (short-subunit alcohol dehydrogenase family)
MTTEPPVAVITGGSRGIGHRIVVRLHERGYRVLFTHSRSPSEAAEVAAEVGAVPLRADMADPRVGARILDAAAELGPMRALVNNAAITGPLGPVTDLTDETLDRVLAVNVAGPLRLIREAVRRHRGGELSVVNISSLAARSGSPGEYVAYAASKAALETLTVGLAKETARLGVRVNAVAPGFVDTTIHARAGEPGRAHRLGATAPLGRPGTPDEVASAVVWLLSEEAGYVTGEVLHVSGGL